MSSERPPYQTGYWYDLDYTFDALRRGPGPQRLLAELREGKSVPTAKLVRAVLRFKGLDVRGWRDYTELVSDALDQLREEEADARRAK